MIVHYRHSSRNNPISGISQILLAGFEKAYKKGRVEMCGRIHMSVREHMFRSVNEGAQELLQEYMDIPYRLYMLTSGNPLQNDILVGFSEMYLSMSNLFRYWFETEGASRRSDELLSVFFQSYLGMMHQSLLHEDSVSLTETLDHFSRITRPNVENLASLRASMPIDGSNVEDRNLMIEEYSKTYGNMSMYRRANLILLSWSMLLYSEGLITEEKLLIFKKSFAFKYLYFEDLVYDLSQIRYSDSSVLFGPYSWYIEAPPAEGTFSPLSINDWILMGSIATLVDGRRLNFDPRAIIDLTKVEFLYHSLKDKAVYFENHMSQWLQFFDIIKPTEGDQVNSDYLGVFKETLTKTFNNFQILINLKETEHDEAIAIQNLESNLVEKTKMKLFEDWRRYNVTIDLFEYFKSINKVQSKEGLDSIGIFTILRRFKTMFVKDGYQEIMGLGHLGANAGRAVDGEFIKEFIQYSTPSDNGLIETLEGKISELREAGYEPNLIIIPPEYTYREEMYLSSKYQAGPRPLTESFAMGIYDGIVVTTLYNQNFKNQFVVCCFNPAFSLSVFENEQYFDGKVLIEILDLSLEQIEQVFAKNSIEWKTGSGGQVLSDDQARRRIAASVMIKIAAYVKFLVADPLALKVFSLKNHRNL